MMKKNLFIATLIILLVIKGTEVFSCTIFLASKNGKTLVGNNEDFIDPNTNMWFQPSENGKFGRVYFGFGVGLPQGGLNDQGLFFDYAALPASPKYHQPIKEVYNGSLVEKAMETCATVAQVIELFNSYDRQYMATYQVIFGDKNGNSVIIESDSMIVKNGDYQVCTNFRQSLNKENPYSIERYNIVNNTLKESNDISVDLFRSILNQVHQEPGQKQGSPTMYSNIYDLKNGIIYIYHFHNYADVQIIDLKKELGKGEHSYSIPSLFGPATFAFNNFVERSKIITRKTVSMDSSNFNDFEGEYHLTPLPGFSFKIRTDNQKLLCLIRGMGEFQVFPEDESKFFLKEMDVQLEFTRDEFEKVNGFTFIMYGSKIPARKIG